MRYFFVGAAIALASIAFGFALGYHSPIKVASTCLFIDYRDNRV